MGTSAELTKSRNCYNLGIKKWKPEKCSRRQCKTYLREVDFIKKFLFPSNFNILVLSQFVLEKSVGNNEYHRKPVGGHSSDK